MFEFAGRIAFITGGASGIGLALGKALAGEGARVVLADINGDALAEAERAVSGKVATVQLDVRDRSQWLHARKFTEARFGPVSILVNNAGIINDGGAQVAQRGLIDQSPDSWDRMIGINLTGVYNGIATFGARMRDRGDGHIVNTASTQGVITCAGVGSYCASKFALEALSDALRLELAGSGVLVSLIEPGPIRTRFLETALENFRRTVDIDGSVHSERYRARLKAMEAGGKQTFKLEPEAVVDRLVHAVEARRPKLRYFVTTPTYIAAGLKRLLPGRVMDRVLLRM